MNTEQYEQHYNSLLYKGDAERQSLAVESAKALILVDNFKELSKDHTWSTSGENSGSEDEPKYEGYVRNPELGYEINFTHTNYGVKVQEGFNQIPVGWY